MCYKQEKNLMLEKHSQNFYLSLNQITPLRRKANTLDVHLIILKINQFYGPKLLFECQIMAQQLFVLDFGEVASINRELKY